MCPGAAGVRTDAARHARKPAPSGRHAVLLSTFSVGRGDVTASLRLCSFEARAEQTARGRCSLTPHSPWNLSPHWSLDKLQGSSESSPKAGDGGERAAERSLRPWQSPCSGAVPRPRAPVLAGPRELVHEQLELRGSVHPRVRGAGPMWHTLGERGQRMTVPDPRPLPPTAGASSW